MREGRGEAAGDSPVTRSSTVKRIRRVELWVDWLDEWVESLSSRNDSMRSRSSYSGRGSGDPW